mmetsp:Transcript_43382/g.105142  ORF Transcript_43382/g.105142 Transcript_43382/m.105142 type:complete len:199 (+) Transcript_43382:177-773(+)
MKTAAVLTSLFATASAFAPAAQTTSTTSSSTSLAMSTKADYADAVGVTPPLGVFDPFNIIETRGDEEFNRFRALEIKHGRVCMLGVVGYLVTYAGVRLPGLEDVPAGFAAWTALPASVLGQFGMTVIFMEMANRDQTGNAEFPGDFRNGYLDFGWDEQSDAWKKNKRTLEINQGRAAMMGLTGLMVHDAMGNVANILP